LNNKPKKAKKEPKKFQMAAIFEVGGEVAVLWCVG
jgi:hypothetical protein